MNILKIYENIKPEIISRMNEFENLWKSSTDFDIFIELCFCLCTPQTKAVNADKAIKKLLENNVLKNGSNAEISKYLKGLVRFHNNKAKYIVEARNISNIKQKIDTANIKNTRDWFFKNVKGLGLKEASHFLRNIGFGENLAILDRHILKNLVLLNVIEKIPDSITYKNYIEIENKLTIFAKKINIPMSHLDFVLWYKEAGKVFK